jgi:hypothetical protein
MQEALENALGHKVDPETIRRLHEDGMAVMSADTVSQAVHDVYCGTMADHDEPDDKDREQARALMAAMQAQAGWPAV